MSAPRFKSPFYVDQSQKLNRRRLRQAVLLGVLSTALVLLAGNRATAQLTINFVPLDETTNPTISPGQLDEETHTLDPGSTRLLAILEHVGTVFEDAFPEGHTIEITYLWDADSPFAAQAPPNLVAESNGQITHSVVRFHPTAATWFIDNTPAVDGEFEPLEQVLFNYGPNSLGGSPSNRFTEAVPNVFEGGYNGNARSGSPASGTLDLVTVAFQEVGHAIGMSSGFSQLTNGNGTGEADDGDFDVPTGWNNGNVMQLLPSFDVSNGPLAHLAGNDAVMGDLNSSERTRPSTADLMAIAIVNDWSSIDLPRKDFLGGAFWEFGINWLGGSVPDGNDDVYIRHNGNMSLLVDSPTVRNLTIQNSSTLNTDDLMLTVTNDILVEAGPGIEPALLNIETDGLLDADDIDVNDGGHVTVTNGRILADVVSINSGGQITVSGVETDPVIDVAFLDINSGSVLLGHGDVYTDNLDNNGTIVAASPVGGDALRLFVGNGNFIDLDGGPPFDGGGDVFAVLGDLIVIGAVLDPFDGEMTIGANHRVTFAGAWQIGDNVAITSPQINLQGGNTPDEAATINGLPTADITAHDGEINVSRFAAIDSNIEFDAGIEVDVATGGELMLNANATFNGGSYSGGGTISFNDEVQINSNTSIGVNRVNLDGPGATEIHLNSAALTLNVDQIDTSDNRFDGVIHTNGSGAALEILLNNPSTAWTMDGTFNANGSQGSPREILRGSPVVVSGTVNVIGNLQFSAPMDVTGTIALLNGNTEVWLAETTHVIRASASIAGAGQLVIADGGTLQAADGSTINAEVYSLGRFEPGTPTGTAIVDDDYSQQPSAVLGIEIAGAPGVNQDLLEVNGAATLAGELELELINGFVPTPGQAFTILNANSLLGFFSNVNDNQRLDTVDGIGSFLVRYGATSPNPNSIILSDFELTFIEGDSLMVTRGNHVSGNIGSLAESDNADVSIQRAATDIQSRTEFVVKGTSPFANPAGIEFTLEGSVFARSNVVQSIELYDYVAAAWVLIDSRNAARSPAPDLVVTVAATGNLSRFVEARTMCIEARVRYQSDNPRQNFASNTDQAGWTIQ